MNKLVKININRDMYSSIMAVNPEIDLVKDNILLNLDKIVYATAAIMTLDKRATKKQKIQEVISMLNFVDMRAKWLRSIGIPRDLDIQNKIAERFGIGISVCVLDYLYKIKWGTLIKIPASNKKRSADYKCFAKVSRQRRSRSIIVESKGSLSSYRLAVAAEQKNAERANIKIASSVVLTSQNSVCKMKDPPINSDKNQLFQERLLLTNHYIRVFNLIGQPQLSRYFKMMKGRIKEGDRYLGLSNKQKVFRDIRDNYFKVKKDNKTFAGRVDYLGGNKYIFTGLDIDLIFYEGFYNFNEYESELVFNLGKSNKFIAHKDGICIGYIDNINGLPENYRLRVIQDLEDSKIKHIQEYTTIVDIDYMDGTDVEKYFKYIFNNLNIRYNQEYKENEQRYDFLINYKGKNFIVEINKFLPYRETKRIDFKFEYFQKLNTPVIYIANTIVPKEYYKKYDNIKIIDRSLLKKIIKKNYLFLKSIE